MTFRKSIFWLHLIAGLLVGIEIFIKSVTGIILAYEPQIVEWVERDIRIVSVPSENATKLTAKELVAKAGGKKPSSITLRSDPAASSTVGYGRDGSVYLNPYTGEVLGKGSKTHDFMHVVEDGHRWNWNREIGRPISSAATLAFFFLAVTGLYLWWPRSVMKFKKGLKGKARNWNWHNVIGFWTLPLLIIASLTGVVMGYQWANDLLYRAFRSEPPKQMAPMQQGGQPNKVEDKETPPLPDLDLLFARAQAKLPTWVSISLRLPQKPGAPISANIEEDVGWQFNVRSQLSFDAVTGEEKKWEPFSEASMGRKARVWARYMHTGEAAGSLGQLLGLIACVGGVFLVWTGVALSIDRYRRWKAD